MSEKWLNHNEWVLEQFQDKYLRKRYRNSIIHASIIEGILVSKASEGKRMKFNEAIKFLLCAGNINSSEFCVFNEIRENRNKIIHEIFKYNLTQKGIDKLLDPLMKKIHEAYKTSDFLEKNLFKKYNIERVPSITFDTTLSAPPTILNS